MISEETIQSIKEALTKSQSNMVIALCDNLIENNPEETPKTIGQLLYLRGNAYRQLSEWGKAMSSYLEASVLDPEGPARQAYANALQILDFYNHDLYNP